MIIVNGIDGDQVDLPGLLTQIQETVGTECLPINLPAQRGRQVVDCFFNPAGDADFLSVAAVHNALVDQVIEIDPALMELYLEQGEAISPEQLHEPFERALREGHLVPICFTSAINSTGITELLDVFVRLLPSPMEGNPPLFYRDAGGHQEALLAEPAADKHVLPHAFKIVMDPYIGKIAVFRTPHGTIRLDSQLYVCRGRHPLTLA